MTGNESGQVNGGQIMKVLMDYTRGCRFYFLATICPNVFLQKTDLHGVNRCNM